MGQAPTQNGRQGLLGKRTRPAQVVIKEQDDAQMTNYDHEVLVHKLCEDFEFKMKLQKKDEATWIDYS